MRINTKLKKYINENIIPKYVNNDKGHSLDHVEYVIKRSIKFAKKIADININMVYTIAAYHDIGYQIDPKNHERISADDLQNDPKLRDFFTEKEIKTMAEAVYDHRASLEGEPRSIYGKIISTADRETNLGNQLQRMYEYRLTYYADKPLDWMIEDARLYIINKFGQKGYGTSKTYFNDLAYKRFLKDITNLALNEEKFKEVFIKVNELKIKFKETKTNNPNMSLDEILYAVYKEIKDDYNGSFAVLRNKILKANNIDELDYYTKDVNIKLKEYIQKNIFPEYEKNDGGHNLAHILEVIRRTFALNDTFKLNLNHNILYTASACHDRGKYIDHEKHHLIAAKFFYEDDNMKEFFTDEQRNIIKEAIEDHRSSKKDEPRSTYGKLLSSADRNTRIEIVFIRSFFVAHERMPEEIIEDYLDYTIKRLSKRYSEENPENMFYEDETYRVFLKDMRELLGKEDEFKDRYCEVNNIKSRKHQVKEEPGNLNYKNISNTQQ